MTDLAARQPQHSTAAWRPGDIASADDWSIALTDTERIEIAEAARAARGVGATTTTLTLDSYPLPATEPRIEAWRHALQTGLGFVLVRNFPVDLLDSEEIELAYLGLGLHLGQPVSQNATGEILTHIRDERLPESGPEVRRYRTNKRQDFHTDGADIIGLLCLHGAQSGGESRLVSSVTVYNEMLARRPDLLEELYRPLPWDRNGEEPEGAAPFFELAPFRDVAGIPRVFYIGWYIRDSQRHPEAPRLTALQREAMDLVEAIANDPSFHVEMDFRPGDVQFLNNARILHSREAYTDAVALDERRHLLRLWLRAPEFADLEPSLRGGIPKRS